MSVGILVARKKKIFEAVRSDVQPAHGALARLLREFERDRRGEDTSEAPRSTDNDRESRVRYRET